MTTPLQRFVDQKAAVERLRAAAQRLAGQQDALRKQLKEFGVDSLDAAKRELAKLEKEAAKAEKELATGVEAFDERWKEKLG